MKIYMSSEPACMCTDDYVYLQHTSLDGPLIYADVNLSTRSEVNKKVQIIDDDRVQYAKLNHKTPAEASKTESDITVCALDTVGE